MTFHLRTHPPQRAAKAGLPTPPRTIPRLKLAAVRRHLLVHGDDLVAALGQVAGAPGRAAANRLIDEIAAAPALLSRHVARLDLLRGLLLLEHLELDESPFPVTAFALAPGGRMLWKCCRLAEGLDDLLRRIGAD